MTKYFIDTEFIEGFKKPLFGKRRHFIELIAIGIYCEDGRSYYAISKEYNYNEADNWVKENVINPLYSKTVFGDARNAFDAEGFHKYYGKKKIEIAAEIADFILKPKKDNGNGTFTLTLTLNVKPEFYGYYADYDWVLLCSLFGRMIDLPKGFPMYCIDLKQIFDEKQRFHGNSDLKSYADYPRQKEEHNALADAKWNYELYKFLNTV